MKKRHIYLIVIFSLVLLVLGILSPLVLNLSAKFDLYNFEKYVNVAQSFSGYLLPFITLIGAVITFFAFYVQYEANQNLKSQFTKEQNNEHFYEMLKIHIENVKEFKIESFHTKKTLQKEKRNIDFNEILRTRKFKKYDEKSITENIFSKSTSGRNCFILMLKDLHFTIEIAFQKNEELSDRLDEEMLLKVAYRTFFWGTNSHHKYPKRKKDLTNKQIDAIDLIDKRLHNIRKIFKNKIKGTSINFNYYVDKDKKVQINFRFIPMSGHSTKLAHYYRHLYQTAKHIYKTSEHQEKEFLESNEIDFRFATLRAQMSNEEQLLLYYNYRMGFGHKWDVRYNADNEGSNSYLFLSKYKMIHNIPLYDTIHHLVEHPEIHFKTYTDKYPNADLFEWS